ncbi:MAG: hypothetical protein HUU34_08785 [Saprospiraceae bacterium]|nr:hypothetical protein [Saprospiraceae bacterium]
MPKVVREDIDNLNTVLTVTIEKSDYLPQLDQQLDKYRREAHMRGFRKGKAPAGLVRKMFGQSLLADIVTKQLQHELQEYLSHTDTDFLGQPLPKEDQDRVDFDMSNLIDYEFHFDLGLSPVFDIKGLDNTQEFELLEVAVSDEMVADELSQMRSRASQNVAIEKASQDNDSLFLEFQEMDGDAIKEDGISFKFRTLWQDLTPESQAALGAIQAGEKIVMDPFKLWHDKDEQFVRRYALGLDEHDPREVNPAAFELTLEEVSRFEVRPLDQEFFDLAFGEGKVSTEAEALEEIRNDIRNYYAQDAYNLLFLEVQDRLLDLNDIPLPDDFLKRWILASDERNTPEQIEQEYPSFSKGFQWTLIKNKLIKQFEIDVMEEEIHARVADGIRNIFGNSPYLTPELMESLIARRMEDEKEINRIIDSLYLDKLSKVTRTLVKTKPKAVKLEDYEAARKAIHDAIEAKRKSLLPQDLEVDTEEQD